MIQVLLSMFGSLIILRILSHLQNFQIVSSRNLVLLFVFFQLPLYLPLFFKELFFVTIIYIGLFLVSLMYFQKILTFFVQRSLEKRSIQFIDEMILLMKTGKSAQSSLRISYDQLSEWEKIIFKPFLFCFEQEKPSTLSLQNSIHKSHQFFFAEVQFILNSSTKVIDQLISFREGMKIQRNLRHRSGQVTKSIRAQAIVASLIYVGMFMLSWYNFNLSQHTQIIIVSLSLFLVGQFLVFYIGGHIKWKT